MFHYTGLALLFGPDTTPVILATIIKVGWQHRATSLAKFTDFSFVIDPELFLFCGFFIIYKPASRLSYHTALPAYAAPSVFTALITFTALPVFTALFIFLAEEVLISPT